MKLISTTVALVFVTLLSCNRQVLHFFFDGVDAPKKQVGFMEAPVHARDDSTKNQLAKSDTVALETVKSIHPDYKSKACVKCHDVDHSYRLNQRQPELCHQCHKKFEDAYPVLHGPVAAGFCTVCHVPHKSQYVRLLKMPARQVCHYCHHTGDVEKNQAHSEISDKPCLDCHHPHGGETKNLLIK